MAQEDGASLTTAYRLVLAITRPIMWWSRLRVTGLDALPPSGPTLVVSNHDSYWDPIAIGTAATHQRQVRALAKSTLWKNRLLAWFMDGMGHIPVSRGEHNDGAIQVAVDALRSGRCIGVFPESTRSLGRSLRAHSGAGRLVLAVPHTRIVCARVIGTGEIVRFARRPRVRVEFFEPAGGQVRPEESATGLMARLLAEIRAGAPPAVPAHSRAAAKGPGRALKS